MEDNTTITLTSERVVKLASLIVQLPRPPPSLLGSPLQSIQLDIRNPENDNLGVELILQWSQLEQPFTLTPSFDLSQRNIALSNYMQNIKYPAIISITLFFDVVLLLIGGFATGSAAYTALPLSLASDILKFKVDNLRSSIKAVNILGDYLVEKGTIYAALETGDSTMTLGDFQVSFQELAGHYIANSTTMTYTGEVTLSYQSSSQSASFQIVQDLSSTAEIQFVLHETSLEGFLSFLKLPQSMADINVPLVGSLHNAPSVDKIGFILKQDAYDSAGLYLKSLFFQVSKLDSFLQYLPSAVRPSHTTVKVSIFNPKSSTHSIGVETNLNVDVLKHKLLCNISILPVSGGEGDQSSTGYICTCLLSTPSDVTTTSSINYISSSSLDSLMAALGLQNTTQAISTSLPVIASLINSIALKQVSLSYSSQEVSNVEAFYIRLMVAKWSLFNNISLNDFDIQLRFSKASGWSAYIEGRVQFGKEYLVSVEFTLPNAGSLYFQNLSEDFTVGKLVTYLGLPALSDVPVLGSILDIYHHQNCNSWTGNRREYIHKWKNHFYEMKGDVGMSVHEKERKQEDAYTKTQTHS